LPGNSNVVSCLRQKFDQGFTLEEMDRVNITGHDMATILRTYFEELPEPLFTFKAYNKILELKKATPEGVKAIIETLPS